MTLVVVGLDAADPRLAERWDLQNLLLDNHSEMETFAHTREMPLTSEVWPAIATGVHPEGEWGHGLDFPEDSWEAYKRDEDPMEEDDRWGEHPDELEQRLREQLQAEVTAVADDGDLDEATEDRLRELGYIE